MYYSLDLNSEEKAALQDMADEAELTPSQVIKQALRLYNLDRARRKAGHQCVWLDENGDKIDQPCGCAADN